MIIFLKPIFFDKIWGGNNLRTEFNYETSNSCGECWGISAHKNGTNIIKNTKYKGKTLAYLFKNHKGLFGNYPNSEFPILVKILDATKDLSIQVHPDDEKAKILNSKGKSECWYILDAEKDTKIIIGHNAENKNELVSLIDNNDFDTLLKKINIHKGDYFYIEAGTMHAICAGTLLLEVQQSSDITYRLYDYNRLENGVKRKLHLSDAIEVIKVPDKEVITTHNNKYFDYDIIEANGHINYISHLHGDYLVILEGSGFINNESIKKGDFLMVSSNFKYSMIGQIKFQRTRF